MAAVLALAVAVLGLSRVGPRQSWPDGAQDYVDALHQALATGVTNAAQFYAPHARVDERALVGYSGSGRAPYAQSMRDSYQVQPAWLGGVDNRDQWEVTADAPLYVSREGAVDTFALPMPRPRRYHAANVLRISASGITDQTWTESATTSEYATGTLVSDLEPLVSRYVRSWAGGDAAAVAGLYTEGAGLADTIAGIRRTGARAVAQLAAQPPSLGGLGGAVLQQVPGDAGPAFYLTGRIGGDGRPGHNPLTVAHVDRLVLLLEVAGRSGCPGAIAVSLHLDSSHRITREERFHRIDSLRHCKASAPRPTGWWDVVVTPDPRAFTITDEIEVEGQQVTLWNSTPQRQRLFTWALGRFAALGLPAPAPTSVTFGAFSGDPWGRHGFVPGAPDILLPASDASCPAQGCQEWPAEARMVALTSLSEFWLTDPARLPKVAEFAAGRGLAAVGGPASQGAGSVPRLAALTLARGLMDQADPAPGAECATVVADFLVLAARVPDPRVCPGTASVLAAQGWVAAKAAAYRQGVANLLPFYTPAVILDDGLLGRRVRGRDAVLNHLAGALDPRLWTRSDTLPAFVDRSGAVTLESATRRAVTGHEEPRTVDLAAILSFAGGGVNRERLVPVAGSDRLRRLARRYLQAWSQSRGSAMATLYRRQAQVRDTTIGVQAKGSGAISALAGVGVAQGGLRGAMLAELPGSGDPAVFVARDGGALVLLLRVDAACPGNLAVVLAIDGSGRIATETRHHRVDDLLRCPGRHQQPGWWDTVATPTAVLASPTGVLRLGGHDVEIRNGTPGLEGLLTWAFTRLDAAGLDPPALGSVTFFNHNVDLCAGRNGQILGDGISLCFQEEIACANADCTLWQPFAKWTVLHEIGHAWIAAHVTPEVQRSFLARAGLSSWASEDVGWERRGVEVASAAFAEELMDEPSPPGRLAGAYSCAQYATLYQVLVSRPPPEGSPCA